MPSSLLRWVALLSTALTITTAIPPCTPCDDGGNNPAGSPSFPALSCGAVKVCGLPDGVYWLSPTGTPYQAQCTDGWALALQIDGALSTFNYSSPYWTDSALLNADAVTGAGVDETKLPVFLDHPGSAVRLVMSTGVGSVGLGGVLGTPLVVNTGSYSSLRSLFSSPTIATTAPRSEWNSAVPGGAGMQPGCNLQGVSITTQCNFQGWVNFAFDLRLGLIMNNQDDCCSVDTAIGVGIAVANEWNYQLGSNQGFEWGQGVYSSSMSAGSVAGALANPVKAVLYAGGEDTLPACVLTPSPSATVVPSANSVTSLAVRFVRFTRAMNGACIGLQELEIVTAGGANVAFGCGVTASNNVVYHGTLSWCVDGHWSYTNGTRDILVDRSNNPWLEFDLGSQYTSLTTLNLYVDSGAWSENNQDWNPGDTIVFMDASRTVLASVPLPTYSWQGVQMPYTVDLAGLFAPLISPSTSVSPSSTASPSATLSFGASPSNSISATSASTPSPRFGDGALLHLRSADLGDASSCAGQAIDSWANAATVSSHNADPTAFSAYPSDGNRPTRFLDPVSGRCVARFSSSCSRYTTSGLNLQNSPSTIIIWARVVGTSLRVLADAQVNWILGWGGQTGIQDSWYDGPGSNTFLATITGTVLNTWMMYTLTRNEAGVSKMYRGGDLIATSSGEPGFVQPMLGGCGMWYNDCSDADVGAFLVYNYALSAEAVQDIAVELTSQFSAPSSTPAPTNTPSPSATLSFGASPSFTSTSLPSTTVLPTPTSSVRPPIYVFHFDGTTSSADGNTVLTSVSASPTYYYMPGVGGFGHAVFFPALADNRLFSSPLAELPSGNGPRSITAWLYLNVAVSSYYGIAVWGVGAEWVSSALYVGASEGLSFDGFNMAAYSHAAVSANVWNHVAYTYDGIFMQVYLNGVSVFNSTVPSNGNAPGFANLNTASNTPLVVGGFPDSWSSDYLLKGAIDELLIYDRALSPAEVAALAVVPSTQSSSITPSPSASLSVGASPSNAASITPLPTPSPRFGENALLYLRSDLGDSTSCAGQAINSWDNAATVSIYNADPTVYSAYPVDGNRPTRYLDPMSGRCVARFSSSCSRYSTTGLSLTNSPSTIIIWARIIGEQRRILSDASINWLVGWWGGSQDNWFDTNGGGWQTADHPANVQPNTWRMYTLTRDSNGVSKLYQKGTLLQTSSGQPGFVKPMIGGTIHPGYSGDCSDADVGAFLVYNYALSAEAVQDIAVELTSQFSAPTKTSTPSPSASLSFGASPTSTSTPSNTATPSAVCAIPPVQYVRVTQTATNYLNFNELQLFSNSGANVALNQLQGGLATVTTVPGMNNVNACNDGDTSAYNDCDTGNTPAGSTQGNWWEVNLGQVYCLTSFSFWGRDLFGCEVVNSPNRVNCLTRSDGLIFTFMDAGRNLLLTYDLGCVSCQSQPVTANIAPSPKATATASPSASLSFGATPSSTLSASLSATSSYTATASPSRAPSPVAAWTFDSPSTLTLNSITGESLYVVRGASWTPLGAFGGGLELHAFGDVLRGSPSNLPLGNSAYTISIMVKMGAECSGPCGLIGWGAYGSAGQTIAMRTYNPTFVSLYWYWNDLNVATPVALNDGDWHQVATTYDGTHRYLYIDGVSVGSDQPGSGNNAQNMYFAIGATDIYSYGMSMLYVGLIDSVFIYNVALSPAQVAALDVVTSVTATPSSAPSSSASLSFGASPSPTFTPSQTTSPAATPTPSSIVAACPTGWTNPADSAFCYKRFGGNNLNWASAESFCASTAENLGRTGGHLATIRSESEGSFVTVSCGTAWIGLYTVNDVPHDKGGQWVWSSGADPTWMRTAGQGYWAGGEPSSPNYENCVVTWPSWLNDQSCSWGEGNACCELYGAPTISSTSSPSPSPSSTASQSSSPSATLSFNASPSTSSTSSSAPSPVLAFHFDGTSASADNSVILQAMGSGVSYVPGVSGSGQAVSFPVGGDAYLVSSPLSVLPSGNAPRSVTMWCFLHESITSAAGLVSWGQEGENLASSIRLEPANQNWGFMFDGYSLPAITYSTPSANAWHHMAFTFDGSLMSLFIDGVSVFAATNAFNWNAGKYFAYLNTMANTPLFVGGHSMGTYCTQCFLHGAIDELFIYDRALTSTEVAALAVVPVTATASSLASPSASFSFGATPSYSASSSPAATLTMSNTPAPLLVAGCPVEWTTPLGSAYCYKSFAGDWNWEDAGAYCTSSAASIGFVGNLATVRNHIEASYVINSNCGGGGNLNNWIGLYTVPGAEHSRSCCWSWRSGEDSTWFQTSGDGYWGGPEPNNAGGTENCGVAGTQLNDLPCSRGASACCELIVPSATALPTFTSTVTPSASISFGASPSSTASPSATALSTPSGTQAPILVAGCPVGWTTPLGSAYCYKSFAGGWNWEDAGAYCTSSAASIGFVGNLATVRNHIEASYVINSNCGGGGNLNNWIGLYTVPGAEHSRSCCWSWRSGEDSTWFQTSGDGYWGGPEPNNAGGTENCGVAGTQLNDLPCSRGASACCELIVPSATALPTFTSTVTPSASISFGASPSSTASPSSSASPSVNDAPVVECPSGYASCTPFIFGTCQPGFTQSSCGACLPSSPTRSPKATLSATRSPKATRSHTKTAAMSRTPTRSSVGTHTPTPTPTRSSAGTHTPTHTRPATPSKSAQKTSSPAKTPSRPHIRRELAATGASPTRTSSRTPSSTPLCSPGHYKLGGSLGCTACPVGYAECGVAWGGACGVGYAPAPATPGAPGFPGLTCGACVPTSPTATPSRAATSTPTQRSASRSKPPSATATHTRAATRTPTRTQAATKSMAVTPTRSASRAGVCKGIVKRVVTGATRVHAHPPTLSLTPPVVSSPSRSATPPGTPSKTRPPKA